MTNAHYIHQWKTIPDDGTYCAICGEAYSQHAPVLKRIKPSIDHTAAGAQYMIPDAPQRKVPTTGLKPKRPQTEKPTLLELYEEETKQPKLF